MSEYITVCPKCRQRIMGDTAYIGQRVACPLCLQEIVMPSPSQSSTGGAPQAAAPSAPAAPAGGRPSWVMAVIIGVAVVALAGGAMVFVMQRNTSKPQPQPTPVTQTHPNAQPVAQPVTQPPPRPASADSAVALWTFDQDNGRVALDTSGNHLNAALVEDASFSKSAKVGGGALRLNGTGYAEVAKPVVDVTRSFTVAAWVNLDVLDNGQPCQTAVSIDGKEVSAFYLQLNHAAGNRFVFNRLESDDSSAGTTMARADFVPTPNTWYHLAGVYDADAKTLSLYVNGRFQNSVGYDSAWSAAGKTAIGRAWYGHGNADFLSGYIDDVRIYNTALSRTQIQALATGSH